MGKKSGVTISPDFSCACEKFRRLRGESHICTGEMILVKCVLRIIDVEVIPMDVSMSSKGENPPHLHTQKPVFCFKL